MAAVLENAVRGIVRDVWCTTAIFILLIVMTVLATQAMS